MKFYLKLIITLLITVPFLVNAETFKVTLNCDSKIKVNSDINCVISGDADFHASMAIFTVETSDNLSVKSFNPSNNLTGSIENNIVVMENVDWNGNVEFGRIVLTANSDITDSEYITITDAQTSNYDTDLTINSSDESFNFELFKDDNKEENEKVNPETGSSISIILISAFVIISLIFYVRSNKHKKIVKL